MAHVTSRAGREASPPGGAAPRSSRRGIPDDVRGAPARAPRWPPHGSRCAVLGPRRRHRSPFLTSFRRPSL